MNYKKELFNEIEFHLLNDVKPSEYLCELLGNSAFKREHPFTYISNLTRVMQSPVHHPEGSVWNHTMLVVDNAAFIKNQSSDSRVFMWAALLHDIGKSSTTRLRNNKLTAYDHDKVGAKQSVDFFKEFTEDTEFITKVSNMIRWHMQLLYVVKNMPYAEIKNMKKDVTINDIALFGLCDRLGRGSPDKETEINNVKIFLSKTK